MPVQVCAGILVLRVSKFTCRDWRSRSDFAWDSHRRPIRTGEKGIGMRIQFAFAAAIIVSACGHQDANPDSADRSASDQTQAPLTCAMASYYHDSLAGNLTASGVPYDPTELSAAHKTLPFGTKLRVVRENGNEVFVTINDRGPFIEGRVIDLSRAAATEIGMIEDGVAEVCLYPAD